MLVGIQYNNFWQGSKIGPFQYKLSSNISIINCKKQEICKHYSCVSNNITLNMQENTNSRYLTYIL